MLVFPEYLVVFLTYLTHNSIDEFDTALSDISMAPVFLAGPSNIVDQSSLYSAVPLDSLAKALAAGDQPDSCVPCLQTAMGNYFQAVSARTDQYCERTRCPFIMEACRQRKKHVDISDGFLLETAKVPQVSYAYCLGRAECKLPDTPHAMIDSDLAASAVKEDETEFLAQEEDELVCGSQGGRACFEKAICRSVRRGVRRARNFCAKTKCPYLQQLCTWGDENRPWALGMLVGKIQPWKYAMGKCE